MFTPPIRHANDRWQVPHAAQRRTTHPECDAGRFAPDVSLPDASPADTGGGRQRERRSYPAHR